jgi:hypothetical protein
LRPEPPRASRDVASNDRESLRAPSEWRKRRFLTAPVRPPSIAFCLVRRHAQSVFQISISFYASVQESKVSPERLMQFGFAYAPPLIIGAAVANKVFDALAGGPKSLERTSRETGASVRGLRAIMNALVGLELSKKTGDHYSLTPESEAFLVSNKPGTLAGFFRMNRVRLIEQWLNLDEIVRTGQPAEARNQEGPGTEFFQELVKISSR